MPQFQSQLGQMGFARQPVAGTAATIATAAPTRWMKLRSSSVGGERDLLIADPEIQGAGGRDVNKSYLGPVTYAGDYEFYSRSEALPLAVFGALGGGGAAPTQPGGAITPTALTGYQHVFTPADSLPRFTIEEKIGDGFDTFRYTDAFFNMLHLECAADGYLMGTLGVVARSQTGGVTGAAPAFDNTPLYVGSAITVSFGGSSIPAESFSFDFANAIENDHFVLGSLFVDEMTPKRREVTGNFTLRPTSNALCRQAMNGVSTATTAGGLTTVSNLTITANTYEIITGATSAVYSTKIIVPEVILTPFKPEASGDDTLSHSIDFQAVKIAAANICTVEIVNGVSAAYNA